MTIFKRLFVALTIAAVCSISIYAERFVAIKDGVKSIEINLNEEKFTLMRNQTPGNKISSLYETTDRGTPQPISLGSGIETLGEIEFIELMKKAQNNENIAIIDSRKPGWFAKLRIPGAVNVPFTHFREKESAIEAMEDDMGVIVNDDGSLDFSEAKTLALYCNGYWCEQTPGMVINAEFSLVKMGYPSEKIKYYRGGMQAWTSLGLTVISDE